MHPRSTRCILILFLLLITMPGFAAAAPAPGNARLALTALPTSSTTAPVTTVACAAPCQCLAYADAISLWGTSGFTQCAELPCEVTRSVTGAQLEKFCYKQKAAVTPATTTPAQVFIPREKLTPIPTTVVQVFVPVSMATVTTVPVQSRATIPADSSLHQLQVPPDLCHYDPAKNQCSGICPQTGKTCVQINESTCGDGAGPGPVKCGCVDKKSPASLAASGLARAVVVSQAGYRPYSAPQKGIVDTVFQLVTGIVKKKPDLSSADPRAYTMDTSPAVGVKASNVCPADLFRTTLAFADRDTAFISTDTGSQKGSFSWNSADPRVRSAVWQVSVLPYPVSRENWSNVPGLLAQGNLEGDERTFTIDFSKNVPTAAEAASVWVDRKSFLVVEKSALTRVRTDLSAGQADTLGINPAIFAANRQKMASGLDTALATIDNRIAAPAAYTLVPGAKTGIVNGFTKDLSGSAGPGSQAAAGHTGTYLAKAGVYAPSLQVPALTKAGVAGTLPQNQRTLFVRVVPFDQNGNYTNNPSNTKEVVIGSPRFNVTSPWSGWDALPELDQTGFTGVPEMVNFGDRLYFFNVRPDHIVYMNSVDRNGAVSGWTAVPGSARTGEKPSVVAYPNSFPASPGTQKLYIFVSNLNTQTIWYTKMEGSGSFDSDWKEVAHQDVPYVQHFTSPIAYADDSSLYLLLNGADFYMYSLVMTTKGTGESWSAKPNSESYMGGSTLHFSYIGNSADSSLYPLVRYAKFDSPYAGHVGYFSVLSTPRGLVHANDPMSSNSIHEIGGPFYIPTEIVDGIPGVNDVAAARYHDRQYFFVRGKNGHIFMNWVTTSSQMSLSKRLGQLHGWEDISPGQNALGTGITSLSSPQGDRLDVFANDIQRTGAQSAGGSGNFISLLFPPKATGLHRNSLGGAPENPQVLSSVTGNQKTTVVDSGSQFIYRLMDLNISSSRTTPVWFAWNSSRPDLYYAEWQVSAAPFDEVNPKFNDKGIVSRGRLNINNADPDFITGYSLPEYTDMVHLFPVNFPGFGTAPDPANPTVTPYYLRVIAVAPTTGPGSYTAYASEQTEVDWGKQDEFVPKFCTAPTFYYYKYPLPQVRITGYTPIHPRDADADCHVIATTGHTYWKEQYLKNPTPWVLAGTATNDVNKDADAFAYMMVKDVDYGWTKNVCDPPADKSWWEKVIQGFKDLFELIASLVNNIADAYNGTKQILIATICGNDKDCETVVSAGVDIGLAALGVPPTLPNFDKLMDEGADYLAATLAEESGIPGSEIALKAGMHEMASSMKNVPSPHDAYGLQPDPDFQYRPARLSIELRNNDPVNTTPPGSFRFEDDWGLFKTTQPDTPFPSLAPGKVMTFPLILKEDQWKGVTCTENLAGGSEVWTVPCDEEFPGQINKGWWEKYQQAANGGDSFTLYYDGMSSNFTSSITSQMEAQYGVPLDTYKGDGWMQDYKSPDCFADKHQLVFQATDNTGKRISSDPITRLNVDSLAWEWHA